MMEFVANVWKARTFPPKIQTSKFVSFTFFGVPGLSCSMLDLVSWSGIEPRTPARAGGFLTTGLPGKSPRFVLKNCNHLANHWWRQTRASFLFTEDSTLQRATVPTPPASPISVPCLTRWQLSLWTLIYFNWPPPYKKNRTWWGDKIKGTRGDLRQLSFPVLQFPHL